MSTVQPITDWGNYISTHATIATATHRLYYLIFRHEQLAMFLATRGFSVQ